MIRCNLYEQLSLTCQMVCCILSKIGQHCFGSRTTWAHDLWSIGTQNKFFLRGLVCALCIFIMKFLSYCPSFMAQNLTMCPSFWKFCRPSKITSPDMTPVHYVLSPVIMVGAVKAFFATDFTDLGLLPSTDTQSFRTELCWFHYQLFWLEWICFAHILKSGNIL